MLYIYIYLSIYIYIYIYYTLISLYCILCALCVMCICECVLISDICGTYVYCKYSNMCGTIQRYILIFVSVYCCIDCGASV